MSTPIFKGLDEIWPTAKIDALVIPETAAALSNNPFINKVHQFDKRKKSKKYLRLISLVAELRKDKYDLAISIQSSYTSSFIMYLSGIRQRVGYLGQKHLNHKIEVNRDLHIRDRVLQLISEFGNKRLNNETEVYPSQLDFNIAETLLKDSSSSKRMAIAPGSVWATKKWPESHFIELIKKCKNYTVFLIGGLGDSKLNESIKKRCDQANITNLAGKLSILESCALIKEMDLVVCNDSAPLHMANAVNTPVFAFFGPTVKKFGCYPYRENDKILELELDCRPCAKHGGNKCPLGHHNCMTQLKPDDVFKKITTYFEKTKLN